MDSNDLFYLFWGIICPLLPEVIVTWVFTRWHFLASALLIISYVIKHLCEGNSDLKLEEVTWYEYKSNKFSHILGPKRTKKHSKRELRHYLILKIWGKQHIRNKGDQLSHSILTNGDDASQLQLFREVCPQGFVNLFLFTLTLFPWLQLARDYRCVGRPTVQIEYEGEKPVQIQMCSTYQNRLFQKR